MANQDFTLSFTADDIPFWIDNSEGMVGPAATLFYENPFGTDNAGPTSNFAAAQLTLFANAGPTSNFAGMLFVTNENVGAPNIFGSGQLVSTSLGLIDIIHYAEQAQFDANQIVFNNEMFAGQDTGAWAMTGTRKLVTDHASDTTLDINQSWSLNVNTSAATGVTITLPDNSPAGTNYTFVKTSSSGFFEIETTFGQFITSSGNDFVNISLDNIGSKLTVISDGQPNSWKIINQDTITANSLRRFKDPNSIEGLALWLDASDTSSIDDSTATPDVDQWDDKSGNGNHVSQGTPNNKPHTGATVNGLNAIDFDGVNDYLSNLAPVNFDGSTGDCYVVFQSDAPNTNNTMISAQDKDTTSNEVYMCSTHGTTSTIRFRTNPGNNVRGSTVLGVGTTYLARLSTTGSAYIMEIDDGTESKTFLSGSDTGGWLDTVPSRDSISVGATIRSNAPSFPMNGRICEIVYYDNKSLSGQDKTDIVSYLKNKWGIA